MREWVQENVQRAELVFKNCGKCRIRSGAGLECIESCTIQEGARELAPKNRVKYRIRPGAGLECIGGFDAAPVLLSVVVMVL